MRAAPPYSPDLIPIEKAFAKLKALLRQAIERSVEGLWAAIGRLVDVFTPTECFLHIVAAGCDPDKWVPLGEMPEGGFRSSAPATRGAGRLRRGELGPSRARGRPSPRRREPAAWGRPAAARDPGG